MKCWNKEWKTWRTAKFQFVEQMKTAASVMEAAVLLYTDACSILDGNLVALCDAVSSMESKESYGTILFDHLAADGAGLAGGQVTVVAVLQVDANFPWCPFYILNSPDKEVPAGI